MVVVGSGGGGVWWGVVMVRGDGRDCGSRELVVELTRKVKMAATVNIFDGKQNK